jgi:ATP-dependent RNA helicase DDX60
VLEGRFGLETHKSLPPDLWNAVETGCIELQQNLKNQTLQIPLAPLRVTLPSVDDPDYFLKEVLDYLMLHRHKLPPLFWEFTFLYFLHIMTLPILPIPERVRPHHEVVDQDLVTTLVESFFPSIHLVMAAFVSKTNRFVDIDGRIFTSILRFAISHDYLQTNALEELVGPGISSRLQNVWRSTNAPPPDLTKLPARFQHREDSKPSSAESGEEAAPFTLLPFHNQIFDDELAAVHVTVADKCQASSATNLKFSQGTPFSDTKHWHAHRRTILPKHLGGEGVKVGGERARQKQLLRDQRFMVQMHRLAATLTGASGRVLQQILIPATGRKVSEIVGDSSVKKSKRDKKVR